MNDLQKEAHFLKRELEMANLKFVSAIDSTSQSSEQSKKRVERLNMVLALSDPVALESAVNSLWHEAGSFSEERKQRLDKQICIFIEELFSPVHKYLLWAAAFKTSFFNPDIPWEVVEEDKGGDIGRNEGDKALIKEIGISPKELRKIYESGPGILKSCQEIQKKVKAFLLQKEEVVDQVASLDDYVETQVKNHMKTDVLAAFLQKLDKVRNAFTTKIR